MLAALLFVLGIGLLLAAATTVARQGEDPRIAHFQARLAEEKDKLIDEHRLLLEQQERVKEQEALIAQLKGFLNAVVGARDDALAAKQSEIIRQATPAPATRPVDPLATRMVPGLNMTSDEQLRQYRATGVPPLPSTVQQAGH